jgi:hypothetical protein
MTLRLIGEVFDAAKPAPVWLSELRDGGYGAPMGALAPGGRFTPTLRWSGFAFDEVSDDFDLIYLDENNRIYFRQLDARIVLLINGTELASPYSLEFSDTAEVEVRVAHGDDRVRLVVSGADEGNGQALGPGQPMLIDLPAIGFVLAGPVDAPEVVADLLYLAPCKSFCELLEERHLAQMSEAPRDFRDLACILARGVARAYDAAITARDSFDLDFATGTQLDVIGSIVGLPREGFTDDRYRDFIRIQIELLLAVARDEAEWTGTCENILRIARTFIGHTPGDSIQLTNHPPYSYELSVPGLDLAEAGLLRRFLRTATYAGVLGLMLIALDEYVMGSDSVAVAGAGIMGSRNVTVTDAMIMGTVITT